MLFIFLLLKIKHDSKLKIIISGDHGYWDSSKDRTITSAAFYGFNTAVIKTVT